MAKTTLTNRGTTLVYVGKRGEPSNEPIAVLQPGESVTLPGLAADLTAWSNMPTFVTQIEDRTDD